MSSHFYQTHAQDYFKQTTQIYPSSFLSSMPDIWHLMSDYWLLITDLWSLTSDFWFLLPDHCLPREISKISVAACPAPISWGSAPWVMTGWRFMITSVLSMRQVHGDFTGDYWQLTSDLCRDMLWLSERGFQCTGLELSPELAAMARQHTGLLVIEADFESFDFSRMIRAVCLKSPYPADCSKIPRARSKRSSRSQRI